MTKGRNPGSSAAAVGSRLVPLGGISIASFDELVGAAQDHPRDRQAQSLCSSQVDQQPEDRSLLHREFAGRGTPEDSVRIARGLPEQLVEIRRIGDQTSRLGELGKTVNRRQAVVRHELDYV